MKYTELRGPRVARVLAAYGETLRELRSYVPDLILVGGAVRDTYFDRPVKDLDYMTCDAGAMLVLSDYLNETLTHCLTRLAAKDYDTVGTLIAAYENSTRDVNVLHVSGLLARIAEFPDSVSQVWTDGESVFGSQEFVQGALARVVKYTERCNEPRLLRLQSKYPDFAFQGV